MSRSIIGQIVFSVSRMSDSTAQTTKEQAYLLFVGTNAGVFLTLLVLLLFHRGSIDASALVGVFLFVLLCIDFVLIMGDSEPEE